MVIVNTIYFITYKIKNISCNETPISAVILYVREFLIPNFSFFLGFSLFLSLGLMNNKRGSPSDYCNVPWGRGEALGIL